MSPPSAPRLLAWGLGLSLLVGVAAGTASALFLLLLEAATHFRVTHPSLVYALPVAGLALGWVLERWGAPIQGGSNLLLDTVHEARPQLPSRMAPMVLAGTVLTHLFGGSAGREGAAVQMGGSLADELAHRLKAPRSLRRVLLTAGMAGGFGSVFGTPWAGLVFGMEVLTVGQLDWAAFVPCLLAAFTGDFVTRHLGVTHTPYPLLAAVPPTWELLIKWALFAVAVAVTSTGFVEVAHGLKSLLERALPRQPLRMALGGAGVVAAWQLLGTDAYLGLGIPTIVRSFHDAGLAPDAFFLKGLLTALTLGAGFLGGEVTPLFFVGATLGNVLAHWLRLPLDLAAGVGLAAVFGTAANTPLALSVMAAELLGVHVLPHALLVTGLAYALTGHRGLYSAQRVWRGTVRRHLRLGDLRRRRAP